MATTRKDDLQKALETFFGNDGWTVKPSERKSGDVIAYLDSDYGSGPAIVRLSDLAEFLAQDVDLIPMKGA